jgi:hypothetical protein
MSYISRIDTALVRWLGKDFSILDTRAEPIVAALMQQVFSLAPGDRGGTQTPAVLKPPASAVLKAQLDAKLDNSYWKCLPSAGVAYRNSPSFSDRFRDVRGPDRDAIIKAVRQVGPHANWLKIELESHGTKYLPIRSEERDRLGETFFERSNAPVSSQGQNDSEVAQPLLFSNPSVVLSINLLSLTLIRLLSSEEMKDSSQITFLQFLLRLVGMGPKYRSSESCGAQVPCGPQVPSDASASEEEICVRLNYAAQVFAAAVVSHCHDAVDSTPQQLCEAWTKTYNQRLQSQVTAAKTLLQVQQILMGAQKILLQGSALVAPPVSLISRFGSLTFEEQEALISDHQLMCSLPSGDIFKFMRVIQAESTSILVRQLIAVYPPNDSESHKVVNCFLDAVNRASDCIDLPLQGKSLQWGARVATQGCGLECSQSHSGNGNCLVCGNGWHEGHSGHTCQRAPFSGRRGSWFSPSNAEHVVPLHVEEISPGNVKVSLDPKSSQIEGVQSDTPLKSDPDKEIGTVVTFYVTRLISAMVSSSAEALIQALILRDQLSVSNLIPVSALVSRLDAAISSALVTIGIEPIFQHPSLTPQAIDALLHVCVFEKRQSMLPEVLRLLKSCSSDVLQGKTARIKSFEALLRLLSCISHGFGCSTLSAFDMILRYVVPLVSNTSSDGSSIINQIIVPRCFVIQKMLLNFCVF